ncbi:MAG: hypothetical protein IPO28_04125 [Holophagaceae bacterium]|nr:hypothetical protein [Holophagaceae bacterium]
MELRLFRLLCLAAAFLSFAVVIPVNTIQNLPWLLNVTIAVFGLVALALYWASLRGSHYMRTFFVIVALVLNLCWFTDAGSQGSIAMFFFAGVMINGIFFRGRERWLFLILFLANVLALLALDHAHPEWSVPSRRHSTATSTSSRASWSASWPVS